MADQAREAHRDLNERLARLRTALDENLSAGLEAQAVLSGALEVEEAAAKDRTSKQ